MPKLTGAHSRHLPKLINGQNGSTECSSKRSLEGHGPYRPRLSPFQNGYQERGRTIRLSNFGRKRIGQLRSKRGYVPQDEQVVDGQGRIDLHRCRCAEESRGRRSPDAFGSPPATAPLGDALGLLFLKFHLGDKGSTEEVQDAGGPSLPAEGMPQHRSEG